MASGLISKDQFRKSCKMARSMSIRIIFTQSKGNFLIFFVYKIRVILFCDWYEVRVIIET